MNHLSFEHFSTIPPIEAAMQAEEPGRPVTDDAEIIPMQFIDHSYLRHNRQRRAYTLKQQLNHR